VLIKSVGKTTLTSFIIETLRKSSSAPLAFFYCKRDAPTKNNFNAVLRGLLAQLLKQDESLLTYIYDEYIATDPTRLQSTPVLESLLKLALDSPRFSFVIMDGLDECDQVEEEKILNWFQSLLDSDQSHIHGNLKLLYIGQRDGILDRKLKGVTNLSLDEEEHKRDIMTFSTLVCSDIQRKFKVSGVDWDELAKKVTHRANGRCNSKLESFSDTNLSMQECFCTPKLF
jgi:NACHT domain